MARVFTGARGNQAAQARERGTALLEQAVERSRPRIVVDRLRENTVWLAQAGLATAAAWVLARQFGHARPIFAPVAALIGVSASLGRRRRSAVEMVIGVALGIGIADALVRLIGSGRRRSPPWCPARWWWRLRWAAAPC